MTHRQVCHDCIQVLFHSLLTHDWYRPNFGMIIHLIVLNILTSHLLNCPGNLSLMVSGVVSQLFDKPLSFSYLIISIRARYIEA